MKYSEFIYYQHEFFLKIYRNYISIITLRKGCNISDENNPLIIKDFSAIVVIIRSILESYLTFFYIYINAENIYISQFRFDCWLREGLITRQNLNPSNVQNKELVGKLQKEKQDIIELTKNITTSEYYSSLDKNKEKDFIKYGTWKPSFKSILLKTNIRKTTKDYLYSFLSSHAHTEYFNLMQISQMHKNNETNRLIDMQFIDLFQIIISFLLDYVNHAYIKIELKEEYYMLLNDWKGIYNQKK